MKFQRAKPFSCGDICFRRSLRPAEQKLCSRSSRCCTACAAKEVEHHTISRSALIAFSNKKLPRRRRSGDDRDSSLVPADPYLKTTPATTLVCSGYAWTRRTARSPKTSPTITPSMSSTCSYQPKRPPGLRTRRISATTTRGSKS